MEHPLDATLAQPAAQNTDHALDIIRRLPSPVKDLDIEAITAWARRLRAERLTIKQ